MKQLYLYISLVFGGLLLYSCSEPTQPNSEETSTGFFPLKLGSTWQYSAYYEPSNDYSWPCYQGIEDWELVELGPNNSWFKIKTVFNGLKIWYQWAAPMDTIIISNEVALIKVNIVGDSLSLDSVSGSDVSVLGWFFNTTEMYPVFEPKIIFPYTLLDSISVTESYFIFKELVYKIHRNVGFEFLNAIYRGDQYSYYAKLELIDYQIP